MHSKKGHKIIYTEEKKGKAGMGGAKHLPSIVAAGWMHPVLRAWLVGIRPWSLPVSIVPISMAGTIIVNDPYPRIGSCDADISVSSLFSWQFIACLVGGLSVHAGANLLNTYHDFVKGVDTKKSADDRTLVDKTMRPGEVRILGIVFFVLATAIAAILTATAVQPYHLMTLYAVGATLAFFYTADPFSLKYHGLGDITVFLCFGPLLMAGVSTAIGCRNHSTVLIFSVPVGLLTEAVLHANNFRDIDMDSRVGVRTLAHYLGPRQNQLLYDTLLAIPFLVVSLVTLLCYTSDGPGWRPLAIYCTVPWAIYLRRCFMIQTRQALLELPQRTAQFSLMFGVVLIGSISPPLFFARFLLGQLFYLGGVNNIMQWKYNVALVNMKLTNLIPLPQWATKVAFIVAIVLQLLASLTFIFGIATRFSAYILLAFLVPVTFIVHDLWVIRDEQTPVRARTVTNAADYIAIRRDLGNFPTDFDNEFVHFFKNCQIMGGLMLYLLLSD